MAATRPARTVSRSARARDRRDGLARWAAARRPELDNLRVLLIGAVIAVHGVMGYTAFFDGWPYHAVQEVSLPDWVVIVVFVLFAPVGLGLMALLFLVAGLLSVPSMERKGAGRFARDRALRLGVPYAAFALVVWPALLYALYRPLGETRTGWWAFVSSMAPDAGPLWFVGLLLLVSLGFAAWRSSRPSTTGATSSRPLGARTLLVAAGFVAAASFAIRLVLPYGSDTPLHLNEWQWPECLALFAVGVLGARQGWLARVPGPVGRTARRATMLAGAAIVPFLLAALLTGVPRDEFLGGPHWAALVVASLEAVLTVFGSVWLLAAAQRHLARWPRPGSAAARSAYAAYVLQAPVLLGLAWLLRALPLGAEIKAPLVVLGGVLGSFGSGWLLVSRVRLLGRIL